MSRGGEGVHRGVYFPGIFQVVGEAFQDGENISGKKGKNKKKMKKEGRKTKDRQKMQMGKK